MRIGCVALACLVAAGFGGAAQAGAIALPAQVQAAIETETRGPLRTLALDKTQMAQTRTLVRTWVSGSMDLSKATQRVSARGGRTSYVQQSATDKLRLPAERLRFTSGATAPGRALPRPSARVQPSSGRALTRSKPLRLVFRESPSQLKFQKLGAVTRARAPLAEPEATQLAQSFLEGNRLLQVTDRDQVGRVYVRERRFNQDRGRGQAPDDYLVQQDVVFERQVDGKPVINSKILVGFAPDTKDIVVLEHFNWTPLQQEASPTARPGTTAPRAAAPSRRASSQARLLTAPTAAKLRSRLEAKVQAASGQRSAKVEVVKAFPAWFQTADSLLPVLVCEISVTASGAGEALTEPYLEVINLAGSDELLFPGRSQPKAPARAR